ncbi:hypothetical protein C8R46DRAFT_983547 [Mycena filopes]|nr:hypothetical protein C8R46DRAFT_983547 [Mycena filopes]
MAARVDDLRKRIDELASAINTHKEAIRELEQTKSEVQGDLNALVDPVGRLPLEISSSIFALCLPDTRTLNTAEAPLIFMRICHSWSTIALSTPSFWTALSFKTPCAKGIPSLCNAWIDRSNALPLSVSISGSLDDSAAGLVKKHADRLERLELALLTGYELQDITVPFPSLTSLTISQGEVDPGPQVYRRRSGDPPCFSEDANECVGMLCAAPNLLECVFKKVFFSDEDHDHGYDYRQFRLSLRLTHLHFGTLDDPDSFSSAAILKHMTMPALETLSITWLDIPPSRFVDFFARSSPPLRKLAMAAEPFGAREGWTAETIQSLLRSLPCLTHLDLQGYTVNEADDIFAYMVLQALSQLPDLWSFTVRHYAPTRSQYEDILRVLRTRPKIQSLSISYRLRHGPNGHRPDPDIVEALQELVAGGMKICIGPSGTNLV